jgi:quercetin dioxygenase-like cupin family protein
MRWISGNASSTGTGAVPQIVDVFLYPALNTLGISHVRLDFDIGGVFPPHTHPFASETLFVVKGTVYTGFISFDDILYAETLQEGDVYIFPKGTLHFQLNVGNGPAVTFNSLNSQNPGFLTAANQLLVTKIPEKVLEASMGINAKTLKLLQESFTLAFGGSR